MTTKNAETEALTDEPTTLTLESGFKVDVQRLKLRQLLRALKVISVGAGPAMEMLTFPDDADSGEVAQSILVALTVAIPEAEEETIAFLTSMVLPHGLHEGKALSKAKKEENESLLDRQDDEFFNPALEDVLQIVETVVEREAPHLKSLGNRLATLLKAQQKSAVAKQGSASKKDSKS